MGSYATTSSLSELIPNFLKQNTTTHDPAGAALFSRHIDRAESVINAVVGRLYPLPFVNVPPLLRTLAEDMACYYSLRSVYTQDGASKNPYADSYKVATDTLEAINKEEIRLMDTSGSAVAGFETRRYVSSSEGNTPIFGLDDPKAWQRDPDEEAAQEGARG